MQKLGVSGQQMAQPAQPPQQQQSGGATNEESNDESKEESKDDESGSESTSSSDSDSRNLMAGLGSVKAHAGDALRKTGDRFGHSFNVSVNYRNSGMESYQRRGVGRHNIKDQRPEGKGRVSDPVPMLNEPALARYIRKIPGFKG